MADQRLELRNWLTKNLDLQGLYRLSTALDVDYENLEHSTKIGKALALVGYLQRRGRLDELARAVEQLRANPALFQSVREHSLLTRCPHCNALLAIDLTDVTEEVEGRWTPT